MKRLLAAALLACSTDPAVTADVSSAPDAASSDAQDAASSDAPASADIDVEVTLVATPAAATGEAGQDLVVSVSLRRGPDPVVGEAITATVLAGGGAAAGVTTDAAGAAEVHWTLGLVPVPQKLRVTAGDESVDVAVDATRAQPLSSAAFADVAGFLDREGISESTEDLVIVGDSVVMGAPGGLISVSFDGTVARRALTGDPIGRGWGLAAADDGTIWIVDLVAQKLVRVGADGVAKAVLAGLPDEAGGPDVPFDGLNDVELGPDGDVYGSDPCLARLFRYDPDTGKVLDVLTLDPSVEGGPNGITFDAAGALYFSTENPSLLCSQPEVADYDATLTRIVRVALTADGFGERTVVAENVGVFGDGLTMDAEGNLYAVVDQVADFGLAESAVWVFPGGKGPGRKLVVADGVLYANVAIGRGALGATTLYLGLLAAPPFTGLESRGLQRVEIGLPRAPWLSP